MNCCPAKKAPFTFVLYRKAKGGREDKALKECFPTPDVADRTEHITNLGRCEGRWLRIACCLSVFFLVSEVQSSDPGKETAWVGEHGSERKTLQT